MSVDQGEDRKEDILQYVSSMLAVKQNRTCFILIVEKNLTRTYCFLYVNYGPMPLFMTYIYLVLKYYVGRQNVSSYCICVRCFFLLYMIPLCFC